MRSISFLQFHRLGLLFLIVGLSYGGLTACNLSSVSLVNLTNAPGGTYNITMQICVGGGITGTILGGDNNTNDFFFSVSSPGVVINSFTPMLTGDSTGCVNNAVLVGPQPALNADAGVLYTNGSACSYTCISSTAACGLVHSDCKVVVLNVNQIPDSIRVYGLEGAGNPFAGCYSDADMLLDFNTLLPLIWGEIGYRWTPEGLRLEWGTMDEKDNAFFVVEQSDDLNHWKRKGVVPAGKSPVARQTYHFVDEPTAKTTYYRLKQVDQNGQFSYSSRLLVHPDKNSSPIKVYPNPVSEVLLIKGIPAESGKIMLFTLHGQRLELPVQYINNTHQLDLTGLPAGLYLLRVQQDPRGSWEEKIRVIKD